MLEVGSTLFLEVADAKDHAATHRCRIVEKTADALYIDYPINEKTGKIAILLNETSLVAWFIGERDKALYRFQTMVLDRCKKQIPMLVLKFPKPGDIHRVQRRQYVRVDTTVDVAVHSLDQTFSPFKTVTADISAGGMAIRVPRNVSLEENRTVLLYFPIHMKSKESFYFKVPAKVIRIIEPKHKDELLKASMQFLDIQANQQQQLIRFCFEQQVLLKRKGMM